MKITGPYSTVWSPPEAPKMKKHPLSRRGNIIYLEYHSVCPFVWIGSSSTLSLGTWGGITRLRVRGRGEPIRTTDWEKAWHSVYYVLWVICLVSSIRLVSVSHIQEGDVSQCMKCDETWQAEQEASWAYFFLFQRATIFKPPGQCRQKPVVRRQGLVWNLGTKGTTWFFYTVQAIVSITFPKIKFNNSILYTLRFVCLFAPVQILHK
jgi:hypothetical protein